MQNEEIDFSEQILAKTSTTCNHCGKPLGNHYMRGRKNIGIHLPKKGQVKQHEDDEDEMEENHFCDANCLKEHLNKE